MQTNLPTMETKTKQVAPRQLTLDGVSKRFKNITALDRISLDVRPGELLSLLGPSGCGKTTTLRLIAGFDFPDEGAVCIDGHDVSHLPPNKRGLGMVFQDYSLFPHLTVAENIGFGLKMAGVRKPVIEAEVKNMLDMVRLRDFADRHISQLSGGQQQRIALARAIVTNPSVLLLDEPLGALDKNLREGMQFEIRRLQQRLGITSVMVTHDQEEAMVMSDRIVVMNHGRIQQIGRPDEVYNHPRTRFVAEFLGTANILSCRLDSITGNHLDFSVLRQESPTADAHSSQSGHSLRLASDTLPDGLLPGGSAEIAVRPEKIRIGPAATSSGISLPGAIREHVFRGAQHSYEVEVPTIGATLVVNQSADARKGAAHCAGDAVTLSFECDDLILLMPDEVTDSPWTAMSGTRREA
jgi:putative spermidine/putrescine transport system ATP-binding protein